MGSPGAGARCLPRDWGLRFSPPVRPATEQRPSFAPRRLARSGADCGVALGRDYQALLTARWLRARWRLSARPNRIDGPSSSFNSRRIDSGARD